MLSQKNTAFDSSIGLPFSSPARLRRILSRNAPHPYPRKSHSRNYLYTKGFINTSIHTYIHTNFKPVALINYHMRTQLLACDILSMRRANGMYVKSVISYGFVVLQHVCNVETLLVIQQNSWKSQGWTLVKPVINGFNWNLTKNEFCEEGPFWPRQCMYASLYVMYLH